MPHLDFFLTYPNSVFLVEPLEFTLDLSHPIKAQFIKQTSLFKTKAILSQSIQLFNTAFLTQYLKLSFDKYSF